ncbi:MAG: hypothetical protein ACRC2H_12190 [Silanimonas sp.]
MPDLGHSSPGDRAGRDALMPIGEALRALPLDAPPHSIWPLVAPKPTRRERAPRWPYALATAAALALALLLPTPGDRLDVDTPPGVDLVALQQESARLERLIAAVDADPLQPADALVIGLAFEDELSGIDAALSAAKPGSRDAALLWQQRVDILSRYAELQSSRRLLASAGQPFETTLVSLY